MAYWSVIVPQEGINLLTNPSGERGTVGWGTITGGTVGTIAGTAVYGAWSGSVAPTSGVNAGAFFGTFAAGNGTTYTASAWVRGQAGVSYLLAVTQTDTTILNGTTFTADGQWHQYRVTHVENTGANRRVSVQKNTSTSTGVFYVDGVRVQIGSAYDTYVDGDQEGCIWTGDPHNSPSYRSAQSRAGGSIVTLSDIGLTVLEMAGVGMGPVENVAQPYAQLDGAYYQRSKATPRAFVLTTLVSGSTWGGLHALRQRAIDLVKPDRVAPQQPARFLYTGAGGTTAIDAVYDGGLGFESRQGFAETFALRMVAFDPYWEAVTDQGTTLAGSIGYGSSYGIMRRSPYGAWSTVTTNGTSTGGGYIQAFGTGNAGTIYLGGNFGPELGGLPVPLTGFWDGTAYGSFAGGSIAGAIVYSIIRLPNGTVVFGGDFNRAGGTVAQGIAFHDGVRWGTFPAGGVTNGTIVAAMALYGNRLYVGGAFSTVNGTTTGGSVAFFDFTTNTWGTLRGGPRDGGYGFVGGPPVKAMYIGLDKKLYVGGDFSRVLVPGVTPGTAFCVYNLASGSWGTLDVGMRGGAPGSPTVYGITGGANGVIYPAGLYFTAGQSSAICAAQWNGVQYTALGSAGVGNSASGPTIYAALRRQNGQIAIGGVFSTAGTSVFDQGLAYWNGANFLPGDLQFFDAASRSVTAIAEMPDLTLYVAGNFQGSAIAAATAQITNIGAAIAYPTLTMRNTSGTPIRLYGFANNTTGAGIDLEYVTVPGEVVRLVTTPGSAALTSTYYGNILSAVRPGGQMQAINLLPGLNVVSFFASSGSLQTTLTWRPRYWSSDGTTP